jgi:Zn-finger in ubiquitin-hydrolases and other protein
MAAVTFFLEVNLDTSSLEQPLLSQESATETQCQIGEISIHELKNRISQHEVSGWSGDDDGYLIRARSARLSTIQSQEAALSASSTRSQPWAAVLMPPSLVDAALQLIPDVVQQRIVSNDDSGVVVLPSSTRRLLSRTLLQMIHPFLAHNFEIEAVVSLPRHAVDHHLGGVNDLRESTVVDLALVSLWGAPDPAISDLLDQTNGRVIHATSDSVLKVILLDHVHFVSSAGNPESSPGAADIPLCPVCLFRLDPSVLGWPPPQGGDRCSRHCPPPDLLEVAGSWNGSRRICPRQRMLRTWDSPSYCKACHVIDRYWSCLQRRITPLDQPHGVIPNRDAMNRHIEEGADLFCYLCSLQETLWVCLTCGFVGCGRYSNKHAAQHFSETGHPFSLELATLRIWNYLDGDAFVHRTDFLDCPSSPPLLHPWIATRHGDSAISNATVAENISQVAAQASVSNGHSSTRSEHFGEDSALEKTYEYHNGDRTTSSEPSNTMNDMGPEDFKSPKKAVMIGEEYETLLQSALEDQAQHYLGEISRLRAELTAEKVDKESMSAAERGEVDNIRSDISRIHSDIDRVSRELLVAQSQEAGYRATSQRLLREQQVSQELLKKICDQALQERETGKIQVEELEQQIADLTANQRMRHQFSSNEELYSAQIVGAANGTESSSLNNKKKGKRRFFRK